MSGILRRWWWVPLVLLVLLGFARLRFDVDVLNLLPPEEPAVRGLKLYQQHFANARELIVSLRAADAAQAESLARELAERLRQKTDLVASAAWQEPWKDQPEQLTELLAYLWFNQPPDAFAALTNRLAPERIGATLAEAREALATSLSPMDIARRAFDPYDLSNLPGLSELAGFSGRENAFASTDGTFRLVFVHARPELDDYRSCSRWLAAIQAAVAELRAGRPAWDGVVVRYTGHPAFVTEIAGGMQRDLSGSVTGTAVIIALLFWLTHRRWLPMLWLLLLLLLILAGTLALGGLLLGTISVVSMGFAAVLLGLAVDYAVVHYQEALAHPRLSVPEIRRAISPSILWAAITTISAFLVLNLGGLPGLAQLGSLVAIGVALAALVMVMVYLPPLFPNRRRAAAMTGSGWDYLIPPREPSTPHCGGPEPSSRRAVYWVTGLVMALCGGIACLSPPRLDRSGQALRLQQGEAESALEEVTRSIGIPQDPLWLVVAGASERDVARRLDAAGAFLDRAVSNQWVSGYVLASPLWPRIEYQQANRQTARQLSAEGPRLRAAALREGFTADGLVLTGQLMERWAAYAGQTGTVWPTNRASQWLLERFVARATDGWLVMGLVYPAAHRASAAAALAAASAAPARDQIFVSGWELLGATTLQRVRERMWLLVVPILALVLLSLWLAFRRPAEILLGAAVMLMSGLVVMATMALAGWSWNLLNLMALPLLLGTGVDYCIFIQLALRRHHGDLAVVRRSVGRALLLCGGTAVTGFGSLAWSGSPGMASLGKVCAVGIGANMLISIYLLPAWWLRVCSPGVRIPPGPAAPSTFYRAWFWRLGLRLARRLPVAWLRGLCLAGAELGYRLFRSRREVVMRNLLPAVAGDRAAARKLTRSLFRQFSLKLLDLWRFENGWTVDSWITPGVDWGILEAAYQRRKGVLVVTPHLGNWEVGGLLLARLGAKLVVLTQAEPGRGFTELRRASRARWGIETVLVGEGGFEFVEIIKRLQVGDIVALLIDRPPAQKAVAVELFGRPFGASVAAAELARASGCAVVGVSVVRVDQGYAARIVREFEYDRRALGDRQKRQELTQAILRAFEPEIRRHLDQWYHFVPVW